MTVIDEDVQIGWHESTSTLFLFSPSLVNRVQGQFTLSGFRCGGDCMKLTLKQGILGVVGILKGGISFVHGLDGSPDLVMVSRNTMSAEILFTTHMTAVVV